MPYMTVVAQDLISHSMEYVTKPITTCGIDSTCLGEIRKFESPLLPVWNVLSVIPVNMELPGCRI